MLEGMNIQSSALRTAVSAWLGKIGFACRLCGSDGFEEASLGLKETGFVVFDSWGTRGIPEPTISAEAHREFLDGDPEQWF
jgi:hypothetical protein